LALFLLCIGYLATFEAASAAGAATGSNITQVHTGTQESKNNALKSTRASALQQRIAFLRHSHCKRQSRFTTLHHACIELW
jgi:hypothetical protein